MATGGGDETIAQRILRITDIAQEPLEFLAPISGYAKMPLVPLEEAVEPLVSILPEVQGHAYVAKQRCKKPADGLSQDESASIMLYTMGWEPLDECLYVVLNATLRATDRQEKLKPWYLYLRLFLNAIFRLPPLRETAYRGVKLDMSKRYFTGETIVWWGFSSCTTTVEVLQSDLFLGETGTRTLFTIQYETARDIRKHSYYSAENEVLLLAATQFKVISYLKQGDLHIIQLKETRPPHPLLQPVSIGSETINSPSSEPKSTLSTEKVTTTVLQQPTSLTKRVTTTVPPIPMPSTEKVTTTVSTKPTSSTEKVITTVPPPLPFGHVPKAKYQNATLEKLAQNEGEAELKLTEKFLTDRDIEIVAGYASKDNKKWDDVFNYPIGYTDLAVYDPETDLENIVESKHLKLSRSARKALPKDLKPTIEQRDKLVQILAYPPGQFLSIEEQDLVWKFRFFLSQHKKALAKFLQCVHWDKEEEAKQAVDLLQQWVTIDTEDALELLGPSYHHPKIRSYAVSRLQQAPDEDLILYLLQLVQALRYERYDLINASIVESVGEEQNNTNGTYENFANAISQSDSTSSDPTKSSANEIDLSTFLIQRACEKPIIANYLFWYASVECENNNSAKDKSISDMYQSFVKRFNLTLKTKNEQTQQVLSAIEAQKIFVDKLVELTNIVKRVQGSAKVKEEKLRSLLLAGDDSPVKFNFLNFDPIPLPLDPEIKIQRINPEKIKIFKSAKLPFLFVCETTNGDEYPIIFKNGDDLRQDQLVLQIIVLMDRILRKENIDLKLTPYKVLSTSLKYGFVQYIDSHTLRSVLERSRTIRQYLQSKSKSEDPNLNEIRIPHKVMDAYVKSCAGYCVMTYLLGVGNRHLDHLLLRDSGQLFHIDFGFIMGRDPKPLPQAMRVSKDMMEMLDDKRFLDFLRHCFTAFIILRKHANVFANLFSLMLDANIPDIALERDKTVKKLLDKFRLDLDDEKAISYLKDLIDSSIDAITPKVYDYFHNLFRAFR